MFFVFLAHRSYASALLSHTLYAKIVWARSYHTLAAKAATAAGHVFIPGPNCQDTAFNGNGHPANGPCSDATNVDAFWHPTACA